MGSRVGIITVQSSHSARISCGPSVAMSSPLANTSKPCTGRAKRKSAVRTMQVSSSS